MDNNQNCVDCGTPLHGRVVLCWLCAEAADRAIAVKRYIVGDVGLDYNDENYDISSGIEGRLQVFDDLPSASKAAITREREKYYKGEVWMSNPFEIILGSDYDDEMSVVEFAGKYTTLDEAETKTLLANLGIESDATITQLYDALTVADTDIVDEFIGKLQTRLVVVVEAD